ncbi:MAG: prolyl aminopeptidase [Sinobacterium sp.]
MNEFYPEITPFNHFMLDVGEGHQLYIEQCGNPNGQPVVFLHGGPGGGCSENDRRFFDPEQYHIILFDQRGCGRSLPHGELKNNDTDRLVNDLNNIRVYLNINKWHVFGGSWGSTLALVYAQTFPQDVLSLVLRGIFLARPQDSHWLLNCGGAQRLFPEYHEQLCSALPANTTDIIGAGYKMLIGDDKDAAMALARQWSRYEFRCSTLLPNESLVETKADDKTSWTLARHEAHFMANDCFLSDNQILNNCEAIDDIPTIIVHGRYDVVCPFDQAWELHKRLPKSELWISEAAGHASSESETKDKLIQATKRMLLGQ